MKNAPEAENATAADASSNADITAAASSKDGSSAAVAAEVAEREKIPVCEKEYFIHPEHRMPEYDEDAKAWKMAADTSLHPYWAIRRLSKEQLKKMENDANV